MFLASGVPDVVVVTGAHAEAVRHAAGPVRSPVRFLHNDHWQQGQITSLVTGLRDRTGDVMEAALVQLVDAPLVTSTTVRELIRAWRQTGAPIVRPAKNNRHGHPVLFDRSLFADLRLADPAIGAKSVIRPREKEILNVAIEDPGAYLDIDTDVDYRAARHLWSD